MAPEVPGVMLLNPIDHHRVRGRAEVELAEEPGDGIMEKGTVPPIPISGHSVPGCRAARIDAGMLRILDRTQKIGGKGAGSSRQR